MYVLGILLGLVCAAASSLAYLFSRLDSIRHRRDRPEEPGWLGSVRLLVCAHVLMGAVCLIAAAILWPRGERVPAELGKGLLLCGGVAVFYFAGNGMLFLALRKVDASRVAPLLGFKVVLLAMVMRFALGHTLLPQQWIAVCLASGAAVMLSATGGRVPIRSAALVLGTCMGFVLSDVCISQMVPTLLPAAVNPEASTEAQRMLASLTGMSLVYVFCGAASLLLLPFVDVRGPGPWRAAMPYAAAWLTAMAALFACFSIVGVVLGNILQSTRGLMSIGIGALIAGRGHHELESHTSRGVLLRRIVAAAVMSIAIALYVTAQLNR